MTISIFDYYDYRPFLKDFYHEKKKILPYFSYRYISQKVEMDSSFIIKVLQGKLHISSKKIEHFIDLCELDKNQSKYFEALVYFSKAKTEKERKIYFEKLLSFSISSQKELTKKQYQFFQSWYHSAVWSLLNFYKYKGDYSQLSKMLKPEITPKEAEKSIQLLTELNLIQKDGDTYKVTSKNITTGTEWNSLAITQYQKEMIIKASEALERFNKKDRNISSLTMNLPENMLSVVEELTKKYRQSLIQLANSCDEKDLENRVYQFNIQLFPLSEKN